MLELKEQKVVRAVGITGHASAVRMAELVRRIGSAGLDTVLCPVNPAPDHRHFVNEKDPNSPEGHFRSVLLPLVREKGLGLIAMKTTAQGTLIGEGPGKADVPTLIRFAMSEPGVAVAIVGPGSLANLKKNLTVAQSFSPLTGAERGRLAGNFGGGVERFGYEDPSYRDA
jgi:aryl-alcohol dehydrogenase-like predicted oxidoreductase